MYICYISLYSYVQTIKAADIATVRKLAKPPYLITLIMDCVVILFGKKLEPVRPDPDKQFLQASWGEALKVRYLFTPMLYYFI